SPSPERLAPMLDAIYGELAEPDVAACEWAVEAFALVGRLLEPEDDADHPENVDSIGQTPSRERVPPPPLARPARLAQALIDGELESSWLRGFGAHPLELRALQAACALRRVAWSRMAHALWKNWQSRGCPADADRLLSP